MDKQQMNEEKECIKPQRRNGKVMKQRIMSAARDIILQEGTDALSIDRIIERAGISKGAFMYHFPTRLDLIKGLMDSYVEHITQVQSEYEEQTSTMLQAYSKWYEDFRAGTCDSGQSILLALAMASSKNRQTLTPLSNWYREYFDRLDSEACGSTAAITVTMIYDALFFHHLFGTDVLRVEEREKVLKLAKKLSTLTPAQVNKLLENTEE